MVRPLIADPAIVRTLIARRCLGNAHTPATLGAITLRSHQRSAVERLITALDQHRGALLADDVGLGKTYVAAAIARRFARVLIAAPAALRPMWTAALHTADVRAEITSYTALSRDTPPYGPFDLLILDEAHHARTPATRRYARLATLATRARVLLLSATPIHNTRADLAALLALFLGTQAWSMDDDTLARYIVRREHDDVLDLHLPDATEPQLLSVGDDEALLQMILALPPPLPPSDGHDGGALVAWSLVRQWTSSNGALTAALRRRLVRAAALDAALADGRHLTRSELATWTSGDRAVQLAFPSLFATADPAPAALRETVAEHTRALRTLLDRAAAADWTDDTRARLLCDIRAAHPGEKIVAFTQFADTVHTLFRRLRTHPGVAALTASGATVAGGTISRCEAIARFAPRASGTTPPRDIHRIDLLLTTDLLSEGINLHDASVIVHLDLPWTPARLEQRVGRSRRIGALHHRATVYAILPPASSETLLRVEARLHDKLRAAGRSVGIAGTILPLGGTLPEASAARRRELLRHALERWRDETHAGLPYLPTIPLAAIVCASSPAILALIREGDTHHLVASLDGCELDDAPATLLAAARLVSGPSVLTSTPPAGVTLDAALALAHRWMTRHSALAATGAALPLHAPARRQAIRRIATITARAPHHHRATIAALAARARCAITAPYGIAAERTLEQLVASDLPDEPWLRAMEEFGETLRAIPPSGLDAPPCSPLELVALLIALPPDHPAESDAS